MGMSGTPAFNINGVVLTGAQPMVEFETIINQEFFRISSIFYDANSHSITRNRIRIY